MKSKREHMDFAELEQWVQEKIREQGQMLLEAGLTDHPMANPEIKYSCPQCKMPLRIQVKAQKRTLNTSFGNVTYARPYGVCDRCGITCVPMDQAMCIPRHGPSVVVRYKVCQAGVATSSFKVASDVLNVQAGISIRPKRVRAISEGEGKFLVKRGVNEVKSFQEGAMEMESEETPELLVITCDGGRVQTRQPEKENRWKEDKIGVVYDAVPQPSMATLKPNEYEGARAKTKTYAATMEPWEFFGWMLRLEAEKRGYKNAKAKLFLGDGAKHIRELKDFHFPDSTFILDWAHAAGHLADSSKAAFGVGSDKAAIWYEEHKDMLWDGKRDRIIEDIRNLSDRLGHPEKGEPETSPRKVLYQNAYSYFPNNKDAINYPAFRAKGWPIGSGVAEGAVKQFAKRLKGSEKFWNVSDTGAEEMLALSALYHCEDGRWDRYWRKRAQSAQRE